MAISAYTHGSSIGMFTIQQVASGAWQVLFDHESLGEYSSPRLALEDLCGGHCSPASGTDTSTLGLPDELGDWLAVPKGS